MAQPLMVAFTVPGKPQAEGRGRAVSFAGRARVYTPAKTRSEKARVRQYAQLAMGSTPPLSCPLRATITVRLPIPPSWPKYRKQAAQEGTLRPTAKPDCDNFAKLFLDGCNGIVYVDDSQIVELVVAKWYDLEPRISAEIVEAA